MKTTGSFCPEAGEEDKEISDDEEEATDNGQGPGRRWQSVKPH